MVDLHVGTRNGLLLVVLPLAVLSLGLALWYSSNAFASNGTCTDEGSTWNCIWKNNPTPPATKRWFDAPNGNNKRMWINAQAKDGSGASTDPKCVGFKRWDAEVWPPVCGGYFTYTTIPLNWRPGWVWISHHDGGNRNIFGEGNHG